MTYILAPSEYEVDWTKCDSCGACSPKSFGMVRIVIEGSIIKHACTVECMEAIEGEWLTSGCGDDE
jgi:hypothetical protein